MRPRRLSFFTELDEDGFASLTARPEVRRALRTLGAGVTVGLRDLGAARARAILGLRDAGIDVAAWLLLPEARGYFATYDNVADVAERVADLRRWTAAQALTFSSLGLDFEPDLRELRRFFAHPVSTVAGWAVRARNGGRWRAARAAYQALVDGLRADGWRVDAYQFPFLLEDRAAGGTYLQRLAGGLDLSVDREVVMAYTSLLGPAGVGLLAAWAPRAAAVAVGSTGGGIDPLPKLGWAELERDLRLAGAACDDVHVFSLEGCVEHGHLERLVDLDWSLTPALPTGQRAAATMVRGVARLLSRLP